MSDTVLEAQARVSAVTVFTFYGTPKEIDQASHEGHPRLKVIPGATMKTKFGEVRVGGWRWRARLDGESRRFC